MTTPATNRRRAAIIAVPALALALLTPVIAAPDAAWADISALGSETATGTGAVTVAPPVGVQEGDFLIAMLGSDAGIGSAIEAPVDWTPSGLSSTHNIAMFWRIAGASEPADYQFEHTDTTADISVVLAAYRGVDPTSPINDRTQFGGTNSTPLAGALTTTVPGATFLAVYRVDQATAPSAPAGMNPVGTQSGAPGANVTVFDEVLIAAGATGSRATPDPAIGNWDAISVAVAPLPAAAVTPATLTESTLDGATIAVQVTGTTFVAAPAVGDFTFTGAPVGTSIASLQRDSDSQVTLTLAFDGTDFDTDATSTITIAAAPAPAADPLPATGPAEWMPAMAILAFALLGLGALTTILARSWDERRSREHSGGA